MLSNKELKIVRALAEAGYLSKNIALKIQEEARQSGRSLYDILIEKKFVSPRILAQTFSEVLALEFVDLQQHQIDSKVLSKISPKFAIHYHLIPIAIEENLLKVCVANPLDFKMVSELETLLNEPLKFAVAADIDIALALKKYYGLGAETVQSLKALKRDPSLESTAFDIEGESSSITRFVNQLLKEAKLLRATDIHIEPFGDELKVRYRIDGVLTDVPLPAEIKQHQAALLTRIKVMANLDIAERRLPQDGRIQISYQDQLFDLRVSILPTPFGESMSIRLLSTDVILDLDQLGFSQENLKVIREAIMKPHGIILLTGPTGSGKTTTLYACLHAVNTGEKKIITIEDPIEYQMKGITQVQVHPKIGLSFSSGLRSMLRHDPDVMMVGEIRDVETAEIAVRVSLTGHLVFSTLHTNDAAGAISRLSDMGIEPYLVSSSLECVVAQRLVRKICSSCKEPNSSTPISLENVKKKYGLQGALFYHGRGCEQCHGTGYRGRTAIHEIMNLTETMRRAIASGQTAGELRSLGKQIGYKSLREDGFEKAKAGITSFEEVLRITQGDEEAAAEDLI